MMRTVLAIVVIAATLAFVLWPLFGKERRIIRPADLALGKPDDAALEHMISQYRRARRACPSCGLRREPSATFCSECGRELSPPYSASTLDQLQPPQGHADREERRG
jgi:hypothetical protein